VLSQIFDVMNRIVNYFEETDDESKLTKCQNDMERGGVVVMVVETLMARPSLQLRNQAMELAIKLLQPKNEHVEESFVRYFHQVRKFSSVSLNDYYIDYYI
jgi:hypothetical protein